MGDTPLDNVAIGVFGDPDGNREQLDNKDDWFVSPTDDVRSIDSSARILVGGKGSGKTILLRLLHAHARNNPSSYTPSSIASEPPTTDRVVGFSEAVERGSLSDAWAAVWRCAILRSVVSHILCVRELRARVNAVDLEKLTTSYSRILRERSEPRDVYSEMREFLLRQERHAALRRLVQDPAWDDLETLLERVLGSLPPMFFFVDAVDEWFERAPAHWLQCQRGLFDRVIAFMRKRVFGERLHLVISIRDSVYYSALRSEHRTRYIDERVVRLHWDAAKLAELLRKKVEQLPRHFRLGSDESVNAAERWLGIRTIFNERRSREEHVFEYLRRHLRPAPRDFVVLGNEVCRRQASERGSDPGRIDVMLRASVARTATDVGKETLFTCAAQIAADMLPANAVTKGYSDYYLATNSYDRSVSDRLETLVRCLPGDRFNRSDLAAFDKLSRTEFHWDVDVPSALWQCGLLGYVIRKDAGERHLFWFTHGAQAWTLPRDVDEYVLHPSLIDALHINSIGSTPVVPEL